ncbi:hypothetical protein RD792_017721 [Penstemon davidsonii]|uniref:EamA domain-containing protein n=1 Tax=Penstemon davidsonii TaxID=160366 RepID=A0ABR0DVY6_9LAMI|nr:hypothetical protein RD792_017721 [Penstemon davidsonii]
MTLSILLKMMLLGLLDPIIGQNLFYAGMKHTTATFTAAMCNVLPALTFVMAWILSQAKILGTVVTVGGAMIMTLIRGADIGLPWTKHNINVHHAASDDHDHPIKGAIMIATGNIGYALFYILQAITLKTYPAGLSLTSLICTFGALQGVALTLLLERGNTSIWSIGLDAKLLAYAYGGIVSSGITYYVSGAIMKEKGPVFVTAFNPLNMVIVAVLSSFILAEQLDLGKITGAVVIIIGLYLVIWGKSKDDCTAILAKAALNQGMNHYTFSVYRNAIAVVCFAPFAFVLERKIRPRMTFPVLLKIALLALLEPVIDQNLYYTGMKYTTATFTSAMCNILPAITFLLAWTLRLEKVNLKRLYDQAKVAGTIVTIGGAMIMTLVRGHVIGFPWTKDGSNYSRMTNNVKDQEEPIKGTIMITLGCFCWSIFYILQANTLKTYPAGLTLTTLICMGGALQGGALTLVVERGNPQVWSVGWDVKLLAYAYAGIVSSGVGYYVSGVVSKEKGPVFLTSFNPLSMVVVAVMSSFIFADKLDVGK